MLKKISVTWFTSGAQS